MPPRTIFEKEQVLNIAYNIVRNEGFDGLNARRIAKELNASVHPIFKHFKDMEELKKVVYEKICAKYKEYMLSGANEEQAYKKWGYHILNLQKITQNFLKLYLCKKQTLMQKIL